MNNLSNLFSNEQVSSQRIIYTPSPFARSSLFFLQEVGSLTAVRPHVSSRSDLASYLVFVVTGGSGWLRYDDEEYELSAGSVVFLDCRRPYSQSSSDDLWSLKWVHMYSPNMQSIWNKYRERGGYVVFRPADGAAGYEAVLDSLYEMAGSSSYTRDVHINARIAELIAMLMDESWHPERPAVSSASRVDINGIKEYIDTHYGEHLTLESLAEMFFINKSYLARVFRESFGETVGGYIRQVRVTRAKEMLRFTDEPIQAVAAAVGIDDQNYFSRVFKSAEGCSPILYRQMWQSGVK